MSKYHMSYDMAVHPEGVTKEYLQSNGLGGCDDLVVISIVQEEDGTVGYACLGWDGIKNEGDRKSVV